MANVGGLLGLCMGFSLVSVVEMVYFGIKEKLIGILHSILGTSGSQNSNTSEAGTNTNTNEAGTNTINSSKVSEDKEGNNKPKVKRKKTASTQI